MKIVVVPTTVLRVDLLQAALLFEHGSHACAPPKPCVLFCHVYI
jgi:hypothetical protein